MKLVREHHRDLIVTYCVFEASENGSRFVLMSLRLSCSIALKRPLLSLQLNHQAPMPKFTAFSFAVKPPSIHCRTSSWQAPLT